ncbi:type II secretion system protein [Clostridium algoriphilum]|uniref:type II secretion system protein n=1 Tax=Clostridium algoriphilum TaxID=198347 RepID=UPI00299E8020|nr:prepilin-type N-terminal cleavage/methylation domain-containing protein [Clostridium algoriphilum]
MEMNLMKMDVIKKKKKKGFTLIELIVVIAIIGILALIAVPKLSGFQDKARRTQVVTDSHQITTAIESILTEAPTGTITAVTSALTITAGSSDQVLKMAGVDPATSPNTKTLTYGVDGGFVLTELINGITYTANRTKGSAAIITQDK